MLHDQLRSATFADKNVGTGKAVTVSGIAITGGGDAGNYTLANTTAIDDRRHHGAGADGHARPA